MPVRIYLWPVAEQHEQIRVAAVSEINLGVRANHLPKTGELALGALPRRVVAIKLVGAKRAVRNGELQIGALMVSCRCDREVARVAVRLEARGEIARCRNLL